MPRWRRTPADGMADSARGIDLARGRSSSTTGSRRSCRRSAPPSPTGERHGVLHVQAFADVDTAAGLIGRAGGAGRPGGVPGAGRRLGRRLPAGRRAARPGHRRTGRAGHGPGRRRRGRHPVDRGDPGRPGGARRLGVRAGRPAGTAGGDAHRRRTRPRLRHHPDARRGDAPARPGGARRGLPRPRGRALRRRAADRRPRARPRRRARAGQRPAHRLGGAAGGARGRAGRGGRAGPGRHRGRLLPVRPAQPAGGGLPGRAPAGHALGARSRSCSSTW